MNEIRSADSVQVARMLQRSTNDKKMLDQLEASIRSPVEPVSGCVCPTREAFSGGEQTECEEKIISEHGESRN